MRMIGIVLVVLAALIAAVPATIDCQAEGRSITTMAGKSIPMRCHYTAMAELGLGLPLLALGAALAIRPRREDRVLLAVVGVALGVAVALVPTVLIGVCQSGDMKCNMLMKPLLLYAGLLVVGLSAIPLVWSRKASLVDMQQAPSSPAV